MQLKCSRIFRSQRSGCLALKRFALLKEEIDLPYISCILESQRLKLIERGPGHGGRLEDCQLFVEEQISCSKEGFKRKASAKNEAERSEPTNCGASEASEGALDCN